MRVAHEDWWLSDTCVLERLRPNDYQVTAYYMPDEEGKPTEVYLFQGDKYIDHVEKVETYNRVMAEQTDEDVAAYIEQQKKIAKFGKYVRENAIEEVGVMKKDLAAKPQGTVAEGLEEGLEVVAVIPQHTELMEHMEHMEHMEYTEDAEQPVRSFESIEDRAFENL